MDPQEVNEVKDEDIKAFLDSSLLWKWGGRQIIHLAAEKGRLDIVKHLVEKGVNINTKDDDDWTPLAYAASMGHMDIVKYLVRNKAAIFEFDKENCCPHDRAVESGFDGIAEFLSAAITRYRVGIVTRSSNLNQSTNMNFSAQHF